MIGIRIRVLQFNGDEAGVREMARSAIRFNGSDYGDSLPNPMGKLMRRFNAEHAGSYPAIDRAEGGPQRVLSCPRKRASRIAGRLRLNDWQPRL
jgi:hypothetical protein